MRLARRPLNCGHPAAGFTIIEMMVVLAIVGIAMTIAPAIISGLAGGRLRAAADELVVQLRETRAQALRRSAPTDLVLDLDKRAYQGPGNVGARAFPPVVDAVDVTPRELVAPGRVAHIRFLADGSAVPARILLRHGSSTSVVAIDWLTGRVRYQ
jgi:general secretion pathway protein H